MNANNKIDYASLERRQRQARQLRADRISAGAALMREVITARATALLRSVSRQMLRIRPGAISFQRSRAAKSCC